MLQTVQRQPGMVVHAYTPSTHETSRRIAVSSHLAYIVNYRPARACSEALSQKERKTVLCMPSEEKNLPDVMFLNTFIS